LSQESKDKDKNKGIKIYYSGEEVGYVSVTSISREVHNCGDDDCDDSGELYYEEENVNTEFLIQEVLNQPKDAKTYPELQNIKAIAFEIKDNIIYKNLYDCDFVPNITPTEKIGIPLSCVERITVHRIPGHVARLHSAYEKEGKPDRKALRKHIQR
jgi:hypothetical protein